VAASLFALGCAAHIEARARTVLRVAMTAATSRTGRASPTKALRDTGSSAGRFTTR